MFYFKVPAWCFIQLRMGCQPRWAEFSKGDLTAYIQGIVASKTHQSWQKVPICSKGPKALIASKRPLRFNRFKHRQKQHTDHFYELFLGELILCLESSSIVDLLFHLRMQTGSMCRRVSCHLPNMITLWKALHLLAFALKTFASKRFHSFSSPILLLYLRDVKPQMETNENSNVK